MSVFNKFAAIQVAMSKDFVRKRVQPSTQRLKLQCPKTWPVSVFNKYVTAQVAMSKDFVRKRVAALAHRKPTKNFITPWLQSCATRLATRAVFFLAESSRHVR